MGPFKLVFLPPSAHQEVGFNCRPAGEMGMVATATTTHLLSSLRRTHTAGLREGQVVQQMVGVFWFISASILYLTSLFFFPRQRDGLVVLVISKKEAKATRPSLSMQMVSKP